MLILTRTIAVSLGLLGFQSPKDNQFPAFDPTMTNISKIPVPTGFTRVPVANGSFAAYLRNLPLRKNKTIYLYNGQPKTNQSLHYAVVDISTGNKDLQQCADAIMRLRAEYFFVKHAYDSIVFGKKPHAVFRYSDIIKPGQGNDRTRFLQFMEKVFVNCGTYTLDDQLRSVTDIGSMQPGDVLIKGGAPGHAEIIADMAVDPKTGKKIFLLVQGYMPAQDLHVLLDPLKAAASPWYDLNGNDRIITASWIFTKNQLKRW